MQVGDARAVRTFDSDKNCRQGQIPARVVPQNEQVAIVGSLPGRQMRNAYARSDSRRPDGPGKLSQLRVQRRFGSPELTLKIALPGFHKQANPEVLPPFLTLLILRF